MRAFKLLLLLGFVFVAVESGALHPSSNASTFKDSNEHHSADPPNSIVEETPAGVKLLSSGTVNLVVTSGFLNVDVEGCIGK